MPNNSKFANASLYAAIGLSTLAAMPVSAQTSNIPGVGTVVKHGKNAIVAPSDKNGEVRITGLAPGEYSVRVFEGKTETSMRVGADGSLAFVTRESFKKPNPNASDPRARRALPVVRRWAEPIRFDGNKSGIVLDMRAQFQMTPPSPCAPPPPGMKSTCFGPRPRDHIDVNSSIAREISRIAPTTDIEAATLIVSEREKNGAYKDATDFARRICTVTTLDFDDAPIRMGDTTIIMPRGGNPKSSGFKCAPQDNMVRVFHSWHAYVGHVTLLR